jgi:hypothetical protein
VAVSTDYGKTWVDASKLPATIVVGDEEARTISCQATIPISASSLTQDGSGGYYVDIQRENCKLIWATQKYPVTETVDDIIAFADSTTSLNPQHYLSASVSGDDSSGLFICSSSDGTLTSTKKGTIELTMAPAPNTDASTFQFTDGGGDTAVKTVGARQTLTIPATAMVKNGDSYSCGFSMSNIVLIKAKFTADSRVEFAPIPKPQMSRVVDFSVNSGGKPLFDTNEVAYGESASALGVAGVTYDENLGYWVTKDSGNASYPGVSGWHHFYNKNITGDFYCLMEEIGNSAPLMYWFDYNDFGKSTENLANCRYLPGVLRMSMPFGEYNGLDRGRFAIWDHVGLRYKMIYGGFTWPVNAVLYMGAQGEALHQYQWQSDGSGAISVAQASDASSACARVTIDACKKLKADWGANIRIYVIKYRKQTSYKHKISGAETIFDYSYLDNCAGPGGTTSGSSGSSGSTAAPYMYDVSSESDLTDALSAIAKDIKSFAAYTPAKNVE